MPLQWGPAALYAMNLLQLWMAGEESLETHEIVEALKRISPDSVRETDDVQTDVQTGAPRPGSSDWIEEMEHLETELAGHGSCDCWG
jgi:hypothetical protein